MFVFATNADWSSTFMDCEPCPISKIRVCGGGDLETPASNSSTVIMFIRSRPENKYCRRYTYWTSVINVWENKFRATNVEGGGMFRNNNNAIQHEQFACTTTKITRYNGHTRMFTGPTCTHTAGVRDTQNFINSSCHTNSALYTLYIYIYRTLRNVRYNGVME